MTAAAQGHVLVVDDDPAIRKVLGALLEQAGFQVTRAASAGEALALVRTQDPDVIITDLQMPGQDGLALLAELRSEGFPEIPVVMLTAHGTVAVAVEAMKRGAFDFLEKPFEKDVVLAVVGKALGAATAARIDARSLPVAGARCGLVGTSEALARVVALIERMAPAPTTVLVTGETGTGKELVARALHDLSPRSGGPFVAVNCGALPDALVESELFGHAKGAFTGADRDRPGRIELADEGTLFLDEIGELPLVSQVKLLRVLQDGIVDPVGSTQPRKVTVRIVAATLQDLDAAVAAGRFRQDLLFRLKVLEIPLPPLRDRPGDIAALVEAFLVRHSRRLAVPAKALAPGALASLEARPWPGNVRELENAVERALLLAPGDTLTAEDFGGTGPAAAAPEATSPRTGGGPDFKEAARAAAAAEEARLIRAALETTGGNVTRAAEELGLSRRGLQLKMKELGLRDA